MSEGFLFLVLGLPPLAAYLTSRSSGDQASWANLTLFVVELVVASGFGLAWYLRRYLTPQPQPRLVPVVASRTARSRTS